MHGVTKEVTLDVEGPTRPVNARPQLRHRRLGDDDDQPQRMGPDLEPRIEAGGVTVSDAVKITLGIEANKPNPNAPPPPPRPAQ